MWMRVSGIVVLLAFAILFWKIGSSSLPDPIAIPQGFLWQNETNWWSIHTVFSDGYNNSMYWGSYRPGNYFGMKTRSENPILTGMMWSPTYQSYKLRHNCRHGLYHPCWKYKCSYSTKRINCKNMDGQCITVEILGDMKWLMNN